MGRKKRVVEGAVLDLTGDAPVVVVGELVETAVEEPPVVVKPEKPARIKVDKPKREKKADTVPEQIEDVEITHEDMLTIVSAMKQPCNRCGEECYSPLRKWGETMVCPDCYDIVYPPHMNALNEWMKEVGLKECAFCGKERINPSRFHFDHINMFEKTDNIGRMLFDGESLDKIKEEIQKCQLLCIECHAIVTKMENKLGFTYLKRKRRKRQTVVRKEDYMPRMTEVYSLIKELRGHGGAAGGK
jgi:hypothetical protein